MEPAGRFKIVLAGLAPSASDALGNPVAELVQLELMRLFNVDAATASSIVSAVPVLILDGLEGWTAIVARARLEALVEAGARLVTTDEACEALPRVNWPELPEVAREVSRSDCPSCGAALPPVRANRPTVRLHL